jgi:hypothetical protein
LRLHRARLLIPQGSIQGSWIKSKVFFLEDEQGTCRLVAKLYNPDLNDPLFQIAHNEAVREWVTVERDSQLPRRHSREVKPVDLIPFTLPDNRRSLVLVSTPALGKTLAQKVREYIHHGTREGWSDLLADMGMLGLATNEFHAFGPRASSAEIHQEIRSQLQWMEEALLPFAREHWDMVEPALREIGATLTPEVWALDVKKRSQWAIQHPALPARRVGDPAPSNVTSSGRDEPLTLIDRSVAYDSVGADGKGRSMPAIDLAIIQINAAVQVEECGLPFRMVKQFVAAFDDRYWEAPLGEGLTRRDLEPTLSLELSLIALSQVSWALMNNPDRPITVGRIQALSPGLPAPAREEVEASIERRIATEERRT